ncbi:TetR/AcrR family transcriptional regulator [Rhodococcus sp. USK13]|uniref:TetR/AcrR family transcriptional regulator n=1 Tax=Rhodococcus sp. USK13 TaxID=2806442 RepID=UPI001BD17616|nr:TetR/AcrR family transcriptional regulator [Rhodococcus sp. USK13]
MNAATPLDPSPTPRVSQRRAQLAKAAADRFRKQGYQNVSIRQVAEDVGLTAPALYRHYKNKQSLLHAALNVDLERAEALVAETRNMPFEDALALFAEAALHHRNFWVLLQRDARHLDSTLLADAGMRFSAIGDHIHTLLKRVYPNTPERTLRLAAVSTLAVLGSPSLISVDMAHSTYRRWLAAAADSASRPCHTTTTFSESYSHDRDHFDNRRALSPQSHSDSIRDLLLTAAIRQFHEHGYHSVTMESIGKETGIAASSIYHYFPAKSDLLAGGLFRVSEELAINRIKLSDSALSPAQRIQRLVHDFVGLALANRELFGLYVVESMSLDSADAHHIRQALRAELEFWTRSLQTLRSDLTNPAARVLIHAARSVVNDVVRIGNLRQRPGISTDLKAIVMAILLTPRDRTHAI